MLKATAFVLSLITASFAQAATPVKAIPALKCTGIWSGAGAKMPAVLTLGSTRTGQVSVKFVLDGKTELVGEASYGGTQYNYRVAIAGDAAAVDFRGKLKLSFQEDRSHTYALEMTSDTTLKGLFVCNPK
jgi:hypothetical protein